MPRTVKHSEAAKERSRYLVTTTTWSYRTIAADVKTVAAATIRGWKVREQWARPNEAQPLACPKRRAAVKRIYQDEETSADIALVARCSERRLSQVAAEEGWAPRRRVRALPSADAGTPSHLAALEAALTEPTLSRAELVRMAERVLARATAAALTGQDPAAERTAHALARHVNTIKNLPRNGGDRHDNPRPMAELRAELARKLDSVVAARRAGRGDRRLQRHRMRTRCH